MPTPTSNGQPAPTVASVPIDAMIKDDRAQRPFDPAWARHLVNNFDRRLLGVLTVSEREDGRYAVIDGWHRRHALRILGFTHAPCTVERGLTLAEEAGRFAGLNKRRAVRYIDEFFVRVVANDPAAVAIHTAIEAAGWKPARGGGDGQLSAVGSLERLHQRTRSGDKPDGDIGIVRDVLRVVTTAWGFNPDAVNGQILTGIGLVLLRYGDAVELAALANKLTKLPGGPAGLLGRARTLREAYRSSLSNCIAEIVVTIYNQRRRSQALPDWRT